MIGSSWISRQGKSRGYRRRYSVKITFIMPSVGRKEKGKYVKSWTMEPLAIAVLSGLTAPGIEKVFYDDRIEPIPCHEPTDLVAINVETYTARRAYQIASMYRSKGIPVVMGGFHATLMPEEVAGHADAVVIGEAEDLWGEVVRDAQAGRLRSFYKAESRPSLKNISPDRSIYRGKEYTKLTLIETGRGCRFGCNFCSVSSFFHRSYRARPVENIVREIKMLKATSLFFVDDNIVADRKQAIDLFEALIPLKIRWISQVSINIYQDEELMKIMKKSGCLGVLVGFESVEPENLKDMEKKVNMMSECYEAAIKQFRKHKICIYGTFLFGYDHDTEKSIEKAYQFALRHKLFYAAFNHLMPFPGTPLYERLRSEKRLIYEKWWLEENYKFGDIVFHPKLMTAEELSELCYKYRYKFCHLFSIFRRGLNITVHFQNIQAMAAYFYINLTARRETDSRRGLPMGFKDA